MINGLIQKFQNLIIQNKMMPFLKFKRLIYINFIVFTPGHLAKIYTFIKTMQKHPKRVALALALKPMFEMLLNSMINFNRVASVLQIRTKKSFNIEIKNISCFFKRKKIIKKGDKSYIIPYNYSELFKIKKENAFLNLMFYNSLDSFNLYEHEQDKYSNDDYHED